MKISRLGSAAVAALAATALVTGCSPAGSGTGSGGSTAASTSDPNHPVYFKYPNNPSFDLVYLADELGYFKDAGVRPKYVGAVDANQIIPLVGNGQLDLGTRMASLTISAIQGGADEKIVAAANTTQPDAPHMEYFVRKGSPVSATNLRALEGKTIGLNGFGACAEYVTKQYLTKHGVDVSKIKWVPTPDTQLEQAVDQGRVDLAIIHAPFSGFAENNPNLTKLFSDYDLDQGASGSQPYTANGAFLRAHPAQVKELVGILGKTENWVNEHPDEARQYIANRLKVDVKNVTRYAYVNNAIIDQKQIQYWIDTLKKYQQIPADTKLTASSVATNEYNPYAKTAKLLASQAENTKVLTSTEK